MEFWGIEVKAGAPVKVTPQDNKLIHISQAAMGEVKNNNNKGAESVALRMTIDDKKFVLGTLAAATRPQISFDLVFEKEFELSHDWKNGSIYLCGYVADNPDEVREDFSSDDFDSEDEEIIPEGIQNGKVEPKLEKEKAAKSTVPPAKPESSAKPKTPVVPKKDDDDDSMDSDDEDDDSDSDDAPELGSDEDDDDDDDMSEDDESDDDDEDDDDEETPKKPVSAKKRPSEPVSAKKRPSESALKTPVNAKKAKSETPQKTEGKKSGGHTATPHPSKKKPAEKTPASKNTKGKEQSPKSANNIKCSSCTKTFNSEGALQSHSKAKHSATK